MMGLARGGRVPKRDKTKKRRDDECEIVGGSRDGEIVPDVGPKYRDYTRFPIGHEKKFGTVNGATERVYLQVKLGGLRFYFLASHKWPKPPKT